MKINKICEIYNNLERYQDLLYKLNSINLNEKVLKSMKKLLPTGNDIYKIQYQIAFERLVFIKNKKIKQSIISHKKISETIENSNLNDDSKIRLLNHNKLSILFLKLLQDNNDENMSNTNFSSYLSELDEIEKKSKKHKFNINRINYFKAIIYYFQDKENFIQEISKFYNIADNTKYNFFKWKYKNLLALNSERIYHKKKQKNLTAYEKIKEEYEEGFTLLCEQNFIFLGDLDILTSNVLLITNYCQFYLNTDNIPKKYSKFHTKEHCKLQMN